MNQYSSFVKISPNYSYKEDLEGVVDRFNQLKGRVYGLVGIMEINILSDLMNLSSTTDNKLSWWGKFIPGSLYKDFVNFLDHGDHMSSKSAIISLVDRKYIESGKKENIYVYYSDSCGFCPRMIDIIHPIAIHSMGLYAVTKNVKELDVGEEVIEAVPTVVFKGQRYVGAPDDPEVFYNWFLRVWADSQ